MAARQAQLRLLDQSLAEQQEKGQDGQEQLQKQLPMVGVGSTRVAQEEKGSWLNKGYKAIKVLGNKAIMVKRQCTHIDQSLRQAQECGIGVAVWQSQGTAGCLIRRQRNQMLPAGPLLENLHR